MTVVEVTQADLDAAAPFMDRFLDGSSFSDDRTDLEQAFARHRREAEQAIAAQLQDPVTVHVNMLRGSIAKPAPSSLWHAYRRELFDAMPEEFRQEARSAALEEAAKVAESEVSQHDGTFRGLRKAITTAIRSLSRSGGERTTA